MTLQVTLLFHESAEDFAERTKPDAAYWGAWREYVDAIRAAGVLVGGNALQPPATGLVVTTRGGAAQVLDGPYAETKEQLGGYLVIEVADMAAAVGWAERCPAARRGAVEIRPVVMQAR